MQEVYTYYWKHFAFMNKQANVSNPVAESVSNSDWLENKKINGKLKCLYWKWIFQFSCRHFAAPKETSSPNERWEGMLGVAASVLAVVWKQMQQLPAMLGPAVHRGKGTVRVRGGMSLWNGMWHGLRNDIIMRNVIYAEWPKEIN